MCIVDLISMIVEGAAMDFIERIFGTDPDGGSGSLELVLIAIPIMVAFLWYRRRVARRGTLR